MIKGFHKEGHRFLIAAAFVSAFILFLNHHYIGNIILQGLILATVVVFLYLFFQFFRVPLRSQNLHEDHIISPCDGKVVVIEEVEETEFLTGPCRQISIFMSPLNVHINWYPVAGKITYYKYHPGKFLVAWHPKSSTENERTTTVIEQAKGKILVRQIAGAVARRIICYAKKDAQVLQGSELGFIKFGSRVDLFIPLEAEVKVSMDQVVKGGMDVIAKW